jgi:DNA-binding CsgD family transcriptional regulator
VLELFTKQIYERKVKMSNTVKEDFFRPALEFNNENLERISKICMPLSQCFGINHFGFVRIFNNGRYLCLTNNPIYQKIVFENDFLFRTRRFKDYAYCLAKNESSIIWPESAQDDLIESLKAWGIKQGFNISRGNKGDFLDLYFFASGQNISLKNLYEEGTHVLKEFITYFDKVAYDLIENPDLNKLGTSPFLKNHYPQVEDLFRPITLWEQKKQEFIHLLSAKTREEFFDLGKRHSLTSRQLECLAHFSTGKNVKEIGRALNNVSPRTVEVHLDKVRDITNCRTKSELAAWFNNKFNHLNLSL